MPTPCILVVTENAIDDVQFAADREVLVVRADVCIVDQQVQVQFQRAVGVVENRLGGIGAAGSGVTHRRWRHPAQWKRSHRRRRQ